MMSETTNSTAVMSIDHRF